MHQPDFERAKQYALERLERDLSPALTYHSWHTREMMWCQRPSDWQRWKEKERGQGLKSLSEPDKCPQALEMLGF